MTDSIEYRVIIAVRHAGSGEARWHAALGVLGNGQWIGESPEPPPDRDGSHPKVWGYTVDPFGGRYKTAGVREVPAEHVDLACSVLRNAVVNPHLMGSTAYCESNWIDADIPEEAVARARDWRANRLREKALAALEAAKRKADALYRDADAISRPRGGQRVVQGGAS
ncbi:MAG: hypothetical protein GVY18_03615 [Bacteroidetes bacterium]|jgi:hypothetical protein|nr:hypothetical protein [Bacteroidota bacterium]